jgi:exodeoxyribonuclease VII large subunit
VDDKRYLLTQATQRLTRVHPRRRLNDWLQRLDDAQASLLRCVKQGARRHRLAWQNLSDRLARVRPGVLLGQRREVFGQVGRRLHEQVRRQLEASRNALGSLEGRLRLLGPEQVLARGYSITTDAATGQVLREAREVKASQRLRTRLKAGEVFSRAEP